MESVTAATIPPYVVVLHRMARLGRATKYSPSKKYVEFELDHIFHEKWPESSDFIKVSLIYRSKEASFAVPIM